MGLLTIQFDQSQLEWLAKRIDAVIRDVLSQVPRRMEGVSTQVVAVPQAPPATVDSKTICPVCGEPMSTLNTSGQPRKFCSAACAGRSRKKAPATPTVVRGSVPRSPICECGAPIVRKGNRGPVPSQCFDCRQPRARKQASAPMHKPAQHAAAKPDKAPSSQKARPAAGPGPRACAGRFDARGCRRRPAGLPEPRVLEAHTDADGERTCLTCIHLKSGFAGTPLAGFVRCTKDEMQRREGVDLDARDSRGWLVMEDTGTRGDRSDLPTYWIREDAADTATAEDCDSYSAHPTVADLAPARRPDHAVSGPPLVVDEVKPAEGDAGIPDGPPMKREAIVALGFAPAFVARMVRCGHLVPAQCATHGDTRDCTPRCVTMSVAYTRESVRSVARSYKDARRSK